MNTPTSLPSFIRQFSCVKLKVVLKATRNVSFAKPWYFEPRFDLGKTLKESKHPYLYDAIFDNGTDNLQNRLILEVRDAGKKNIKKGELISFYLTVVTKNLKLINDLCEVLPQWINVGFLKKHHFSFEYISFLDPKKNQFNAKIKPHDAILDFNYFSSLLQPWRDLLSIRFITPTTFKINGLITEQIPYQNLINRISRRVYELTCQTSNENTLEKYISSQKETLRLSELKISKKPLFKYNKKYDMSGVTGFIHYQVPYSLTEDYLLTIAQFCHIGTYTQMGNGALRVSESNTQLFQLFINKLEESEDFKNITEKEEVIEQVKDFSYMPETYRIIKIPKDDGTYRTLNIPHPNDLLLQSYAKEILSHLYEPQFLSQNYAYRKGKGAIKAIKQILHWKKKFKKNHYIIRCDVNDFFDTISLPFLVNKIFKKIKDPFLIYYIQLWIKSGIVNSKNEYELNKIGIPQGSALSPLLANIYLHALDKHIANQITTHFIRYADDIILLLPENKEPLNVLQNITHFLQSNLNLELNKEFLVASLEDEFSFLGIRFSDKNTLKIHQDKLDNLPYKIRHSLDVLETNPEKLTETITGLKKYYGNLLSTEELEKIDIKLKEIYTQYLYQLKPKKQKTVINRINLYGLLTNQPDDTSWFLPSTTSEENHKHIKVIKPKTIDHKLKEQRSKHLQQFADTSELIITEYGTYIGTSRGKLVVRLKGKTLKKVPIKKLRQISILNQGVNISSKMVQICEKNNIQIIYYNKLGKAYASTLSMNTLKPKVIQKQLSLPLDKQKIFILRLTKNKVKNQLKTLKYYNKYYQSKGDELKNIIHLITQELKQLTFLENTSEQLKQDLFLWEARCAAHYWKAFKIICSYKNKEFPKREHQGARDLINQMLNYGYAILESKVMRNIHIWGLSPTVSYYHSSEDNHPGLCYDLMEQYRSPIVDRSILALLKESDELTQTPQGLLSLNTRKKIISKINEHIFRLYLHQGKDKTLYEIMQWQVGQYLKFIRQKKELPKFYNATW